MIRRFLLVLLAAALVWPLAVTLAATSTSDTVVVGLDVQCSGLGCDTQTRGCTDPEANNYDPSAQIDDGSCLYDVPNVTNFQGQYNAGANRINLSWVNPVFPRFSLVRLVRQTGGAPTGPNDGELVYEGTGQSAVDTNVTTGLVYYYAIFVKDTRNQYSSGVITSVSTGSTDGGPCVGAACDDGGGGDGGGGGPDPFGNLPPAPYVDPIIGQIKFDDFFFYQPGLGIKKFQNGSLIDIDGNRSLTVYIGYDRLPEVLKTIAVTLFDPDDPRKTFTFLLRANADKTRYTGTIAPLVKSGRYRVVIHIINYYNQSMKKIEGDLLVAGVAARSGLFSGRVEKVGVPLAISTGLAIGLGQALVLSANITSAYDLYLLLLKMFGALAGFLGLRRKSKPWGTVYDAITKRPIDPAYVRVTNQFGEEVASAITDLDGRYGFYLPPGIYEIQAGKTHYRFPSKILGGKESDEVYRNLYYGDPIQTLGEEIVDRNIPLDPVGFDWNEFMKNKTELFRLHSRRELIRNRIFDVIYAIGFGMTLVAVIFTPTLLNIFTLSLYVLLYAFQVLWRVTHRVIAVERPNGEPIPFAIVSFFFPEINQRMKSIVTDQFGRFYALVSPGTYYITVEERQPDGSYRMTYQSKPLELKKGVLTNNVIVPQS